MVRARVSLRDKLALGHHVLRNLLVLAHVLLRHVHLLHWHLLLSELRQLLIRVLLLERSLAKSATVLSAQLLLLGLLPPCFVSQLSLLLLLVSLNALPHVVLKFPALPSRKLVQLKLKDVVVVLVYALLHDVDDASLLLRSEMTYVQFQLSLLVNGHLSVTDLSLLGLGDEGLHLTHGSQTVGAVALLQVFVVLDLLDLLLNFGKLLVQNLSRLVVLHLTLVRHLGALEGGSLSERLVVQVREDALEVVLNLLGSRFVHRVLSVLSEGVGEHLPEVHAQLEGRLVLALLEVQLY